MSNVVREDIDALNAVLTVTVSKEKYLTKFNKELVKYKDKARIKGFRQGKTPDSLVRKLYGKPILSQILDEEIQHQLSHYLEDNNIELIGSPIPSKDMEPIDVNVEQMVDYTMKFDIGLQPQFEIDGLNKIQVFDYYEVAMDEEKAQEEFNRTIKSFGERVESTSEILADDLVKLAVAHEELGIENEFSLEWDSINEDLKTQLLNSKVGGTLNLDPFKLEEGRDENFAKRFFLGIEIDDVRELPERFDFKISSASRIELPPVTEEILQQAFGEATSTEEEALKLIKNSFARYYKPMADTILYRRFQDRLSELNQFELPEAFIQRLHQVSYKNVTEENAKQVFESSRNSLNWEVLTSKIVRKLEVQISEYDIRQELADRIISYLGGQFNGNIDFIEQMVDRMMEDEKSVREAENRVVVNKLREAIKEQVTINTVKVSEDELKAIWDELVKKEKQEEQAEAALNAAPEATAEDTAETATEA
jgi:trigger factor